MPQELKDVSISTSDAEEEITLGHLFLRWFISLSFIMMPLGVEDRVTGIREL